VALASVGEDRLVAFFIWRTQGRPRLGTPEEELRRAFAGAGWHVPALLDRLPGPHDLYFDEVAQVSMPRWRDGRAVLLGDAAFAVSLIAGKGATLAMAGALVLADALADRPGAIDDEALAAYEARLLQWVEAAQRMAKLNVHLFTPSDRLPVVAREAVQRLARRRHPTRRRTGRPPQPLAGAIRPSRISLAAHRIEEQAPQSA
jgi:2-polyprenyl-6-methoxyphenol hydroxylase-like FAD-dependent oxidoreductase